MLVLTRGRDQRIRIGKDVEVIIADIRGDRVRVGINAPASIDVHRSEVYDQIQRERLQAGKLNPKPVM